MRRFISAVVKKGVIFALVLCAALSIVAAYKLPSEVKAAPSETVYQSSGTIELTGNDALLDFYKEKVDKLNRQCNILLIICVLLLVALIVSRFIQPKQDSIYQPVSDKTAEKKRAAIRKSEGLRTSSDVRGDVFEDAINSKKTPEGYEILKDAVEDFRDGSSNK